MTVYHKKARSCIIINSSYQFTREGQKCQSPSNVQEISRHGKIRVSDYEEVLAAAAKYTDACEKDRKVYPACREADLVVPALPLYDQAHHPVIFSLQVMRRR